MLCIVLVSEHKDKYSIYITVEFILLYLSLCLLFDIPFLETQFLSCFQLHVEES